MLKIKISRIRAVGLALMLFFVALFLFNFDLVAYILGQAYGQVKIIVGARSIDDVLEDELYNDEVKSKLLLIQKLRTFAVDSIGLNDSDNYKTFYDQKGQPLLWLLKACPPFELKPHYWSFPFVGTFPYKGFFYREAALAEQRKFVSLNFDTRIGTVGGWSTLGFLSDPVLSQMLKRSEGELAELIFHELTHATVFVKDSMQFNENLATFVGETGAEYYLKSVYGVDSPEYLDYVNRERDNSLFYNFVLNGAQRLDSLYQTFGIDDSYDEKLLQKKLLIDDIKTSLDTTMFAVPARFRFFKDSAFVANNAYFIGYRIYRDDLSGFRSDFEHHGNSNLRKYVGYLKERFNK